MTFDEKNDRINVTMCKTNEKERKSHEETQKFIFRETGVCTGSGRCLCRSGKYMEISVSLRQSTEEECSFSFMLYLR